MQAIFFREKCGKLFVFVKKIILKKIKKECLFFKKTRCTSILVHILQPTHTVCSKIHLQNSRFCIFYCSKRSNRLRWILEHTVCVVCVWVYIFAAIKKDAYASFFIHLVSAHEVSGCKTPTQMPMWVQPLTSGAKHQRYTYSIAILIRNTKPPCGGLVRHLFSDNSLELYLTLVL